MITEIQIKATCDRNPLCPSFAFRNDGAEPDYDAMENAMRDDGWIVTDLQEHICPACVMEYEAEQRELARERARDEWADNPARLEAARINAGGL